MAKLERDFQATLIKELESIFPGCLIQKNDANYRQGVPDILILFRDRWALLEVKQSGNSPQQPNQEWYVEWAVQNSFGAFIFPENKTDVLTALREFFLTER